MRRIHAWGQNKKGEFTKPLYHEGPWWAVIGEEISSKFNSLFFDLGDWFEKFTREYEGKEIKK